MSESDHETHLPTFGHSSQAHSWLSGSVADAGRARSASGASGEGPGSSLSLSKTDDALSARPCQAFRRTDRLSRTDDFSSVFAFRRALRSEHFQLLYRPAGLKRARLGLVVAKRLAGRAVERNSLKRIAREAFRMARFQLPACDLVLRLATDVSALSKASLRAEMDDLLKRIPK